MTTPFKNLSLTPGHGPTLTSIRRMANLRAALSEISRRSAGIDCLPYEAYSQPREYVRWNPNLLDAYPDGDPLRDIQDSLLYGAIPDATKPVHIKGRVVECGTIENRIRERAIARKLSPYFDHYFSDGSYGFRPGRSPETAILAVRNAVRKGAHWALRTDISHFFRGHPEG
jgi:hypothetical protein